MRPQPLPFVATCVRIGGRRHGQNAPAMGPTIF